MQLSIKIDRTKALSALQKFPKELGDSLRRTVKAGVRDIQVGAIQDHKFTSRSGNADRSIQTDVNGLRGRVFLDTGIAPYSPHLHEGTGFYGDRGHAYRVEPKKGRALRFVQGGRFRFSRGHLVTGIKGDKFLFRSAEREKPNFEKKVRLAINRTIKSAGI